MERDLLSKLKGIYKVSVRPDVFGKRDALPSEVQNVLGVGRGDVVFRRDWDLYSPTELDIKEKGDGER